METTPTLPADRIPSCGDVSCEFLVDPIPRPRPAPFTLTLRPEKPEVVFIANQKPNAPQILELAQKILRERGVDVREQIPVLIAPNPHSQRYLAVKRQRMNHALPHIAPSEGFDAE